MRLDLLLLDVGGVLLQPAEPVDATYLRMGRAFGVRAVDFRRAFAQVRGRQLMDGRPYWRAVVREATGCADPEYFEALYQHYATAQAWRVAPGALALIGRLRAEGTPVALLSNWDTRLRGTLDALGLLELVDAAFISGELGVEKPDPRIFALACRRFGVPPSRALMVGDSWSKDVLGATRAGVQGLHFGEQVADFDALAQWIERPPWHADSPLALPEARALVARAFPDLSHLSVRPLGQGWDSTVFSVGEQAVLRAPRRPLGAVSLHVEVQVLSELELPEAPRVLRVSSPVEGSPYPVVLFERIPGVSLEAWSGDRTLLARDLGRFLRRLHGTPSEHAPQDTLGRLEPERLLSSVHQRGEAALDAGWLFTAPVPPVVTGVAQADPVLLHGDLYARHIHVDADGGLVGLVDWGDVHLGHPAVDLAGVLGVLPPAVLGVFLAEYGPVAAETLALARLRGMHHQLGVLAYAMDIGDAPLAEAARLALGWLGAATGSE